MTLDSLNAVFYTLAFVVPGFVMHSVLSLSAPRRDEGAHLSFIRFFTLSCLNYAVWSWLIYLTFNSTFFTQHPSRAAVAWGVVVFISPVVLGLLGAQLRQREVLRRLLQKCGFRPIHAIPTGWDYVFQKADDPAWVLVTLKDGSQVAGLFGTRSFASSEPAERDLYLESIFKIPDSGPWQVVQRSAGILIRADQISHIEFWTDQKEC